MRDFILRELDRVGLSHNTFTPPAIDLVVDLPTASCGRLATSASAA